MNSFSSVLWLQKVMQLLSSVAKGTVQWVLYLGERDIIELTEEVTDAGSVLIGENCKSLKSVHCPQLLIFQNPYLQGGLEFTLSYPILCKMVIQRVYLFFGSNCQKSFVIFKWASVTWPIRTFFTGSPLEIMNLIF